MKQKIEAFKQNNINLLSKERLKSYSIAEDKSDIEIQIERHDKNLNLIQRIVKNIAYIEIGIRNLLDYYMKEKYQISDWIEYKANQSSSFKNIVDSIKERYVDSSNINNNQLLSNLTLGQVIKIIKDEDASDILFDFNQINFKKYYQKNRNRTINNKSRLTNKEKVDIMLSLLANIRNRAFHWESLIKLKDNGHPRLTVGDYGIIYISVEATKIEDFLQDILDEIYKNN